MIPSKNCIDFIKGEEGFVPHAYHDKAGVLTIGFGTTVYAGGTHVQLGDIISPEKAEQELTSAVNTKAKYVSAFTQGVPLNQNQFDALCSFTYNVGEGALKDSTLLKRVKANPSDPTIKDAFLMWDKIHVDGKLEVCDDLLRRRAAEASMFFKPM